MAEPLKQASFQISYHIKFHRSASKAVCINRREPPKMDSAGSPSPVVGPWLTPWKYMYASPQVLSCDIKWCKRNEGYSSEKFDHRVLGPDLQ